MPRATETHLVHGDFDPANILVSKFEDSFKITAILDWEFAFSGSPFWDIANMLHYAHHIPAGFEQSFLDGLINNNVYLPKDWKICTYLLNLSSLLYFLPHSDKELRPNQYIDICNLIKYYIQHLTNNYYRMITLTPYNVMWPKIYEAEASAIQGALGSYLSDIHHIGSTSVSGLTAKPIIDIIGVVRETKDIPKLLEAIDFTYKGEYNLPFRLYFSKEGEISVNLHIYEENHPEIELNILFRNYLRAHPAAATRYSKLKTSLVSDQNLSYQKNDSFFRNYTLGKNEFIQEILKKAGFNRICFRACAHHLEWEAAKEMRQQYFFDKQNIADPYHWTFNHSDHVHFVLYKGTNIIGYAHVELLSQKKATLHIIFIKQEYRNNNFGIEFLKLCEKWLKSKGILSLHIETSSTAKEFYFKK